MNIHWKNFLIGQKGQITEDGDVLFPQTVKSDTPSFHPLPYLSVLVVSGADAAKFLQGQCTCDIAAISETRGSIGGFCNSKGRTISTFIAVKRGDDYLLIMPTELAESMEAHLQRFVLRATVAITFKPNDYCLLGINNAHLLPVAYPLPQEPYEVVEAFGDPIVQLPTSPARHLLLATPDSCQGHWKSLRSGQFVAASSTLWRHMDIDQGIPWLDLMSSVQFIPQMLNLDRLGGIGLNKGCYTGQEVVARTQYLGAVKRRMFLAESNPGAGMAVDLNIIDGDDEEEWTVVGKLLSSYQTPAYSRMLLVLQTSYATSDNLRLQNAKQDRIVVKPLTYVTDPS